MNVHFRFRNTQSGHSFMSKIVIKSNKIHERCMFLYMYYCGENKLFNLKLIEMKSLNEFSSFKSDFLYLKLANLNKLWYESLHENLIKK